MVDRLLLRDRGGDELGFLLCSFSSPSRTQQRLAVHDGAGFLLLASSSGAAATRVGGNAVKLFQNLRVKRMAMVAAHRESSSSGGSIGKHYDAGGSMYGTQQSRLKLWRESMRSARNRVRYGGSSSSVSAPFSPISSPSRSRCREKQRKEASRLQAVNKKLTAMNKLLMEENDRLQKQVSQLVYENGYMRQQLQNSVVTTPQQSLRDANNPAGLLSIAEETLAEFLSKATGTAVNWVQMPGMKPGPDSLGIVAISHSSSGVAARACSLVNLEPTKIAEILKDRPSWFRDCRCLDVYTMFPAGNGGIIELIYMQIYAPTTLAPARDFWILRYSTTLEDGSLVVCERSLSGSGNVPNATAAPQFVRAEMLPSGYLIRPCEGGGSIIHIVDHLDLEAWSVPEVLRPLYQSSKVVAQKMTVAALRHIRQIAQETSGEVVYGLGRQPAVLRNFSRRLSRGFNDAVNGFNDDGWSVMNCDGTEDLIIAVNSGKSVSNISSAVNSLPFPGGVLCVKASMLLQMLEIIRLEGHALTHEEAILSRDVHLLQTCSGVDENAVGACSELIFAPIDEMFPDDAPLLPSGFRIIPLDSKTCDSSDSLTTHRTLDLASSLEVGQAANRTAGATSANAQNTRSVLTIAFQFPFESHLQDSVATMGQQYARSLIASVQRVAMAIAPSGLGLQVGPKLSPTSPEALTLAQWVCQSYSFHFGAELLRPNPEIGDSVLKLLWHHPDAILCCSLKSLPVFTFSNQAGFDMLETTLVALQDITLDKIFDESGQKSLCSDFAKIMQQGFAYLPNGICVSTMGRHVSYEQAIAWKVFNEENVVHCIAFSFVNWSFV
ncbi:hypothetical protein Syun_016880 [Stephania yunnanensis]|uniref:START domain-containing protein n=1 Tax=Stephania yunnanensis TaxID=152371 RepID=A0AAP0J600_9MAGN